MNPYPRGTRGYYQWLEAEIAARARNPPAPGPASTPAPDPDPRLVRELLEEIQQQDRQQQQQHERERRERWEQEQQARERRERREQRERRRLPPLPLITAFNYQNWSDCPWFFWLLVRWLVRIFVWCFHAGSLWTWVSIRDRLARIYNTPSFLVVAATLLLLILVPPHQPEHETTLNPFITSKMMLRAPPPDFLMPTDTLVSESLAPRNNDLALSASVLRSFCANMSAHFSPHITNTYYANSRHLRRILEQGHMDLRQQIVAQRRKTTTIKAIQEVVREARGLFYNVTRKNQHVEYEFSSQPHVPIKVWDAPTGNNATLLLQATRVAYMILDAKNRLGRVASQEAFIVPENWRGPLLDQDMELAATKLEKLATVVESFAEIRLILRFKNVSRRASEAVFRHVPWSGAITMYMASGVWRWVSASEQMASAFIASAVHGHTTTAAETLRKVRQDYGAWKTWASNRPGNRSIVDDIGSIGAEGQGIADAIDILSTTAATMLKHYEEETMGTTDRLAPCFGIDIEMI
ncbi:hypothetical protein EV127DRAFT_132915 [Xylaria flabelliformis]|nr:hypothetical protein EV127DRAFT_132915 [Xylaria flabelliformis]